MVAASEISMTMARDLFDRMIATGKGAAALRAELGIELIAGDGDVRALVREAITASPKPVADYCRGKKSAAALTWY
jgi:aspartyl-tRNA(Asn)/glutamyl-tRNA(Gln) amidotransferase subunit B